MSTSLTANTFELLFPELLYSSLSGMIFRSFQAGDVLVMEGATADEAFLLLEGVAEVMGKRPDGGLVRWAELGPGAFFGEMALLGGGATKRNATVLARSAGRMILVPRDMFLDALAEQPAVEAALATEQARQEARAALDRSPLYPLFDAWGPDLEARAQTFEPGQDLMREGDPGDGMYILLSGSASVLKRLDGIEVRLAQLMPGACAGELSLITGAPRSSTVRAEGKVRALFIDKAGFLSVYASSEAFREYLSTLQRFYQLPDKGLVYRQVAVFEGASCLQSTYELDGQRRIVCTIAPERRLHVVRQANPTEPAHRTWTWKSPTGQAQRLEVDRRGVPQAARIVGDFDDLQLLYGCFFAGLPLPDSVGAELERTGRLRLNARQLSRLDDGLVCTCMEVSEAQIRRVVRTYSPTVERLEEMLGCGTVCGSCRFHLEELVAGLPESS